MVLSIVPRNCDEGAWLSSCSGTVSSPGFLWCVTFFKFFFVLIWCLSLS